MASDSAICCDDFYWDLDQVDLIKTVTLLYQVYCPEAAVAVEAILAEFVGEETFFLQSLCRKYDLSHRQLQSFLDQSNTVDDCSGQTKRVGALDKRRILLNGDGGNINSNLTLKQRPTEGSSADGEKVTRTRSALEEESSFFHGVSSMRWSSKEKRPSNCSHLTSVGANDDANDWLEMWDDNTNQMYFFNIRQRRSSWTAPFHFQTLAERPSSVSCRGDSRVREGEKIACSNDVKGNLQRCEFKSWDSEFALVPMETESLSDSAATINSLRSRKFIKEERRKKMTESRDLFLESLSTDLCADRDQSNMLTMNMIDNSGGSEQVPSSVTTVTVTEVVKTTVTTTATSSVASSVALNPKVDRLSKSQSIVAVANECSPKYIEVIRSPHLIGSTSSHGALKKRNDGTQSPPHSTILLCQSQQYLYPRENNMNSSHFYHNGPSTAAESPSGQHCSYRRGVSLDKGLARSLESSRHHLVIINVASSRGQPTQLHGLKEPFRPPYMLATTASKLRDVSLNFSNSISKGKVLSHIHANHKLNEGNALRKTLGSYSGDPHLVFIKRRSELTETCPVTTSRKLCTLASSREYFPMTCDSQISALSAANLEISPNNRACHLPGDDVLDSLNAHILQTAPAGCSTGTNCVQSQSPKVQDPSDKFVPSYDYAVSPLEQLLHQQHKLAQESYASRREEEKLAQQEARRALAVHENRNNLSGIRALLVCAPTPITRTFSPARTYALSGRLSKSHFVSPGCSSKDGIQSSFTAPDMYSNKSLRCSIRPLSQEVMKYPNSNSFPRTSTATHPGSIYSTLSSASLKTHSKNKCAESVGEIGPLSDPYYMQGASSGNHYQCRKSIADWAVMLGSSGAKEHYRRNYPTTTATSHTLSYRTEPVSLCIATSQDGAAYYDNDDRNRSQQNDDTGADDFDLAMQRVYEGNAIHTMPFTSGNRESLREGGSVKHRSECDRNCSDTGDWGLAVDPKTDKWYYYNRTTRETSWTKPQVTEWVLL